MNGYEESVREVAVPRELGAVADLAPVDGSGGPQWLVLGQDGRISRWDPVTGQHAVLAATTVPVETEPEGHRGERIRRRLHASGDGDFAAVVNDYGRFGELLDLRTGEVTRALDGQSYNSWTVPFSLAFVEHQGRCVVVHRTDWNRLDVSDPGTGELLTGRPEAGFAEHHLDFFHGALYPSPDGRRILDDGWLWHPIGIPAVWRLDRWLGENPWESEDGPSRLDLCDRAYYWNHAMTWIGPDRVAVGGLGDDDDDMRAGARIFELSATANEVLAFEGPGGRFFSDGTRLFSSDDSALSAWDPTDGRLLGTVPGFSPTHHHASGRQFLELEGGAVRLLAY
ncbi:hypothetical protein [Kitasatospora viridis]|uniref:WD40 repeat protein n=1 Tax=Kitasatospora viridis TaxID=281105 RepID=A0A561SE93_9ACTN|nr:hypothetical protein [Kitasatospora viridis]TWF73193.1 hypothetical protein FHX73_16344 [Kitasatospora viridis]